MEVEAESVRTKLASAIFGAGGIAAEATPGVLASFRRVLKENWDYAKVSTRWKSCIAHLRAKLADVVSKVRCFQTSDLGKGKGSCVWSLFCRVCETEMPAPSGYRFQDCYVDQGWVVFPM